jgi:hypothetical protein
MVDVCRGQGPEAVILFSLTIPDLSAHKLLILLQQLKEDARLDPGLYQLAADFFLLCCYTRKSRDPMTSLIPEPQETGPHTALLIPLLWQLCTKHELCVCTWGWLSVAHHALHKQQRERRDHHNKEDMVTYIQEERKLQSFPSLQEKVHQEEI